MTAVDVIVEGPAPCYGEKVNEKKLKKVIKEGGKRGVEIEGAADMGGLAFFCTKMEEPQGDCALLLESMKAMNAKSDPSEEERKGGAGKLGKIVISSDKDCTKLAFVAYVPRDKEDKCSAREWLQSVVDLSLGDSLKEFGNVETCGDIDEKNYAKCQIDLDSDKGIFPIKFRDTAISHAYAYLRARDLFPADDEDDDEEYVFGDEDFPEA